MKRFRWTSALVLFGLGLPLVATADTTPGTPEPTFPPAVEHTPLEIVREGFDRVLNYPSVRKTRLRVFRDGRMVSYRDFDVVYQRFEGQGHTLLRFTAPDYLRNEGLLIIEDGKGSSEAWLCQAAEKRPRRVGTYQKRDTFYGTDLTLEDLEHHVWEQFELRRLADRNENGRSFYVVEAIPPEDSQYTKLHIAVEKNRLALARVDFFRGAPPRPAKTLRVDLEGLSEENGYLKVRRFWMEQAGRDASTEAEFLRIDVDQAIARRVFSALRLQETGEDLLDLVKRLQSSESESVSSGSGDLP